jgi:hypothetical protein
MIPLPSTNKLSTLRPHCFRFQNSCPILLNGMDPRAIKEITRALVADLNRKFSVLINHDLLIQRYPIHSPVTKSFNNHIVVLGASNAKRLVPALLKNGFIVTDLSRPGWIATEENIDALIAEMSKMKIPLGFGVIMDLLGNATYWFEQFDGSAAMPFKEGYKYHFAGKITVCPLVNFKYILNLLSPIFLSAQPNLTVIFPPMPRHLDTPCCGNPTHSTNVREEGYAGGLLDKITGLRKVQKQFLLEKGVQNFWLVDGVAAIQGIPPTEKRGSNRDSLAEIVTEILPDGVHLTDRAYRNIAETTGKIFTALCAGNIGKKTGIDTVSDGASAKKETHFWRGFISPVGRPGSRLQPHHANFSVTSQRFNPNARPRGGRRPRNKKN